MKKQILATLACMGVALASQAATITWTFNAGTGDVGSSSHDFASDGGTGYTLSAVSSGDNLYLKSAGVGEIGLGLIDKPASGDNEIAAGEYVAFKLPTAPPSTLSLVLASSLTDSDAANVYWNALTPGAIGAPIGTFDSSHSTVDVSGISSGYLSIVGTSGDLLLVSVTATVRDVPDGGTTLALLGGALTLLGFARRKLIA